MPGMGLEGYQNDLEGRISLGMGRDRGVLDSAHQRRERAGESQQLSQASARAKNIS